MTFLADQHVHSDLSGDCSVPMREMARAAVKKGVDCLCFTDHCDLEDYQTGAYDPDCFDGAGRREAYENALFSVGGDIEILLGLELGESAHRPEKTAEILACGGFDLIIGSIHNLRGDVDFYTRHSRNLFISKEQCMKLLERYVKEHLELARFGGFDVIAHIGYPLRYMKDAGFDLTLDGFRDEFAEIFRLLAGSGRGIEVNTAGVRRGMGEVAPSPELIRLFRDCGGQIVTIGSDAHTREDIAADFSWGVDALKDAGFTHYTVFRGRKPEFYEL